MGSIRKHGQTGFLFFDFRYQGVRCREYTALPETVTNKKKLEKILRVIEADITAGSFEYRRFFPGSKNAARFDKPVAPAAPVTHSESDAGPRPTSPMVGIPGTPRLKDFAEIWYQEKVVEWRASYRTTIRATLDCHLIPRFGEKEVGQITKADILAFRADLAKVQARGKQTVLSNPRINKILNPLRMILNEAADRYDFHTPFQNIKQLKTKKTDVQPFSLDEVKRILATVRSDFRPYWVVRFFTGMRTGEVHGLKWKHVDFERRLILVRETIVNGKTEYTKTDGSQRDIQISQMVFDALKEQEKATGQISEYVFCTRSGQPLDHKNVTNRVWHPLLRHLGLAKRRPYQCRHTAATLWLASGESPQWIAAQLGHTTTEMLFRVYARFVPNLTRQDGSAFERLLLQSGTAPANNGTPHHTTKHPETETTRQSKELCHE